MISVCNEEHSYINTRVSIMADRLVKPELWCELIEKDLDYILKQLPGYARLTDQNNVQLLEQRLVEDALADFQILFRPFHGVQRKFLTNAAHWYELFNLKTLIRGKLTGASQDDIRKQLLNLGVLASLPLKNLLDADTPDEMLRMLEKTSYAGIVRHARLVYEEDGNNLFSLDAAIDRNYFISLSDSIRLTNAHGRHYLRDVFGSLMDRFNLLWLLRYRFSYGLSPSKSYYLLATTGKLLKAGNLMKLARLESLQEVLEQLPAPLQKILNGHDNLNDIEKTMELYVLSAASRGLKQTQSPISRVFSYVLLREANIRYLQAIIKGKQLRFDEDLIKVAAGSVFPC